MVATHSRPGASTRATEVAEHVAVFNELAQKAPESAVLAVLEVLGVAARDELKAPFVARALHALTRLAEVSTRRSLSDAAGAASDTMVLLEALDKPDVLAATGEGDPLAEARIRGVLAQDWLLNQEGGTCSAEELGQLLGQITRQAVDNRRKSGKLLALDLGKHGYGYPAWQVHRGRVLPGLDRVIAELDECDPWTQVGFMLSPNSWLNGETPLAELRRGEVDRVVATAEMFSE
jgi:hypothetical protein